MKSYNDKLIKQAGKLKKTQIKNEKLFEKNGKDKNYLKAEQAKAQLKIVENLSQKPFSYATAKTNKTSIDLSKTTNNGCNNKLNFNKQKYK